MVLLPFCRYGSDGGVDDVAIISDCWNQLIS